MNNTDPLQRLFRAAAAAHRELPVTPPAALYYRVMSRRRTDAVDDDFAMLASLFRRAVVCAACIMVLSIGWSWLQGKSNNGLEMALANYAMNIQLPP